jgi:WD40-like Beta Propeller Repeat
MNNHRRKYTIIFLLTIGTVHFLFAQSRALKKANAFYKTQKYAAAIPYFEAELKTDTTKNNDKIGESTLSKLANCYRMTNKMPLAEKIYAQLTQSEKAKPIYFFYLGEALMGSSQYEAAKHAFETYSAQIPKDTIGKQMAFACDMVKDIVPLFPAVIVKPFAHNSDADESSPIFWKDQIVFASDRKRGFNLLKETSGWTGRDYINLYSSKRINDSTYAAPQSYKLNSLNKNTANATFASDSTEVYFTQNSFTLNKSNGYNLLIFNAISSNKKDDWHKSDPLPFCLLDNNYMHPAISPDGKELFFTSDKPSGEGGTDIYVATRTAKGWGVARSVGNAINTPSNEGFPFMHPDGKHLFFCSKGHVGFGGFDIFVTERDAFGNWKTPVNVGKPINSPSDDIAICIAKNNTSGMFTSSRDGGDDDIYMFHLPKDTTAQQPIAQNLLASLAPIGNIDTLTVTDTFIFENLPKFIEEKRLLAGQLWLLNKFNTYKKSWVVDAALNDKLMDLATILTNNPTLEIEIIAHLSCAVPEKERHAASLKRANMTRLALLRKGDFRKRITSKASEGRCKDGEGAWKDALVVRIVN